MDPLLVVAIDFGTTYSGWAYSLRHDYEKDPTKVSAKVWRGGSHSSQKCPTCILIKPDGKTTEAFGYDAENKYADKVEEESQHRWFFFKRFKMMLYNEKGKLRNATIEDVTGKSLPAMTVFSGSIDYLMNDVLDNVKKQVGDALKIIDIRWVLTVPAIWKDAAKQFMREAAQAAGIPGQNLTICLEPEAASIYCRHLPVQTSSCTYETVSLSQFSTGTKYMVLDAGGGTVDITVHEITREDNLKELYKATGGDWGGTKVDKAFEAFISSIVGKDVMVIFKNKYTDDYLELCRSFELKKREFSQNKDKMRICMPVSLSEICKEEKEKDIKDLIEDSPYQDKVKVKNNKWIIHADVMKGLFESVVQNIIVHVASLLRKPLVKECASILLVGGFSECQMLHESMMEIFPQVRMILPRDAGLAVLKGAVIFGHEPTAITERVCKYTYGTATTHTYKNCTHPKGKVDVDGNGDLRCYDIFSIHAKAGQVVKLNEEQPESSYSPVTDDQTAVGFKIYTSSETQPYFVTEAGCKQIGEFSIPIRKTYLGSKREFRVSFIFGGTEIRVKVVDMANGKVTYESVDFLG